MSPDEEDKAFEEQRGPLQLEAPAGAIPRVVCYPVRGIRPVSHDGGSLRPSCAALIGLGCIYFRLPAAATYEDVLRLRRFFAAGVV